ncbi:MAG TPA: GAF domain-containing sensor histidine kinase [Spirochaetia bacterium]|nr:GAF domain-containing sensor histidine kinase [Spirochaetia bacterium]
MDRSNAAELILFCRVGPALKSVKRLEGAIMGVLQAAVGNLQFAHAALVLSRPGREPACWQVDRDQGRENGGTYRLLLSSLKHGDPPDPLSLLGPAAQASIPVILRAGDPIGTMEIGIFHTGEETARRLLNQATSLARHIADTIQESLFARQKDRSLRKLAVWLETVCTISSTMNIGQILHVVAQLTADLFAARCCFYLLNEEGHRLDLGAAVGSYDQLLKKRLKALKGQPPFEAITQVVRTGQPLVLTPDNIEKYVPPEIIADFDYHYMILVPVVVQGVPRGVMQVDRSRESGGFNQEEISIILAMARETAIAMENARLIETLAQKEELLHQLVTKLITAQEDERKRIASEIHDGAIQALIGIWYRMQRLTVDARERPAGLEEELTLVRDSLYQQIQDIRLAVYNLRPVILDNHGLGPAIRSLLHSFEEEHHLQFELALEGAGQRLPATFEITVYRILQEALANVVKHARATRIQVILIVGREQTVLVVRDNGIGFDTLEQAGERRPQLGLASIRERVLLLGGQVRIESQPGTGTTLTVTVPTPRPQEVNQDG